MSTPENELSRFQSYSASHTLIMCDGIRTADLLYGNTQPFFETGDDPEKLFDVQTIPSNDGTPNGRYIVLFDGRKDANYFIKSVEWETMFAPLGAFGEAQFESMEQMGEMIIEEPFGIEFLEALVKGTSELGVDPAVCVFMLKTYFVGYYPDGSQGIIDNILPFTFILLDIKSEMKAAGSVYKISFVGTVNGISKLPQISSIGNGVQIQLKEGSTLVEAITVLEDEIEAKYAAERTKLISALEESEEFEGDAQSLIAERYQDVRYRIQLDREYQKSKYIVGENKAHHTFNDDSTFNIKFPSNASLETCIKELMKSCKLITEEAVENTELKKSWSPKIVSSLAAPENTTSYQVNYFVKRYETQYQAFGEALQLDSWIEFDYIYSGKNIDVLDYEIRMDMGLSFFNTKIAPKSSASTQSEVDENATSIPARQVAKNGSGFKAEPALGTDKLPIPRKSPLFLGMTVEPRHFNSDINQAITMSFEESLARQAELETIQSKLKIVGNPTLLNETLSKNFNPDDIQVNLPDERSTGLSEMYNRPGYVKVNVSYPSAKDLSGTKKFWYDGFFRIFAISNEFKDGVFTQTLELMSISASSAIPKQLAERPVETQSDVVEAQTAAISRENQKRFDDVNRASTTSNAGNVTRALKISRLAANDNGNNDPNRDPDADLYIKRGVILSKIDSKIFNIYDDVVDIWAEYAPDVKPVITSGNDGTHKRGSLHGQWKAIDLRANNLHPDRDTSIALGREIARALAIRIGNDYDVIYENYSGYVNNHIHLEYDPKIRTVLSGHDEEGANEQ